MSNGVLNPTPSDGQVASEGVFASNNELLEDLDYNKRKRFQKFIALATGATRTLKNGAAVPDNRIQLDANKELCKLAGDYPAEKWDITGNLPITVVSKIEREPKPEEFKGANPADTPTDNQP